jgi:hypothetical protein
MAQNISQQELAINPGISQTDLNKLILADMGLQSANDMMIRGAYSFGGTGGDVGIADLMYASIIKRVSSATSETLGLEFRNFLRDRISDDDVKTKIGYYNLNSSFSLQEIQQDVLDSFEADPFFKQTLLF